MIKRPKNISLWPKWDIIFSDIVDLLAFKANCFSRKFLWFILIFFFFCIIVLEHFIFCNYNYYGIWLIFDIDFFDGYLWFFRYIFNYFLIINNNLSISYIYIYICNYISFMQDGFLIFFFDYVSLYWFMEACLNNEMQTGFDFIYNYNTLAFYLLINTKFYVSSDYMLKYYDLSFYAFDYRYLKIKLIIQNLFFINFWVDLLNFLYDDNLFKPLTFIKNLSFIPNLGFLFFDINFGLLNNKMNSILKITDTTDFYFDVSSVAKVVHELFFNVVDAHHATKNHFSKGGSIFYIKDLSLFFFKLPFIYFNLYLSVYNLFFEFIFVLKYLLYAYVINVLVYYDLITHIFIYYIWNLTDIFCYQICIFVIFWEN